ncbi:glutathione S-transferase [Syncephalis fuscata]|nr:glutathione S-transferase [Syncephalis fuscata]
MTITSNPVISYFKTDFQGLGGAIYLLLSDAGVEYKKHTFEKKEWPALKEKLITSGESLHGIVPTLELDGKVYAHQQPILRLLSRRLGKYDGADSEETYAVDAFSDLVTDFRFTWSIGHWGEDEAAKKAFKEEKLPRFLSSINRYLAKTSGPYIIGDEPTYADFKLLATLLDTKPDIDGHPHIKTFSEAIRARPGVVKYLNTLA